MVLQLGSNVLPVMEVEVEVEQELQEVMEHQEMEDLEEQVLQILFISTVHQ
jgi:hypothetical protein